MWKATEKEASGMTAKQPRDHAGKFASKHHHHRDAPVPVIEDSKHHKDRKHHHKDETESALAASSDEAWSAFQNLEKEYAALTKVRADKLRAALDNWRDTGVVGLREQTESELAWLESGRATEYVWRSEDYNVYVMIHNPLTDEHVEIVLYGGPDGKKHGDVARQYVSEYGAYWSCKKSLDRSLSTMNSVHLIDEMLLEK